MMCLEYILKGIKREGAYLANPRKERQPISLAPLNKLVSMWEGGVGVQFI